mgnify:CR=1 FL=1
MASKIKVDTLETVSGSGTITSSNPITVTGALTATTVVGNGAALTNLPVSGLGVGQTWQNVTSSRAVNTTYTNSTGRPIYIAIRCTTTAGTILLTVDSLVVGVVQDNDPVTNGGVMSAIVPNGKTYIVTYGATVSIIAWSELR